MRKIDATFVNISENVNLSHSFNTIRLNCQLLQLCSTFDSKDVVLGAESRFQGCQRNNNLPFLIICYHYCQKVYHFLLFFE